MNTRESTLERLATALNSADCFGRVPAEAVYAAERELGVKFPTSFRLFLEHYGAAIVPTSVEIYGLPDTRASGNAPPYWSNLLDEVPRYHRCCALDDACDLVPISHDGCTAAFLLDTNQTSDDDECPVIAIGPGINRPRVSRTFTEFVESIISGPPTLESA